MLNKINIYVSNIKSSIDIIILRLWNLQSIPQWLDPID